MREMKTKVVNKKTSSFDVYIGRGSKWGNPFRMKSENQRGEVIEKYEEYARQKFSKDELAVLVGKRLGCFCKPRKCHGDILVKLIEEYGLE
jgi:hypothetical protein